VAETAENTLYYGDNLDVLREPCDPAARPSSLLGERLRWR